VEGVDAGDELVDDASRCRICRAGFAPVRLGPQALRADEDRKVISRKW
jgi:hypothetical protein